MVFRFCRGGKIESGALLTLAFFLSLMRRSSALLLCFVSLIMSTTMMPLRSALRPLTSSCRNTVTLILKRKKSVDSFRRWRLAFT